MPNFRLFIYLFPFRFIWGLRLVGIILFYKIGLYFIYF
ncbi:hypothetical protein M33023_02300 [Candidatus Phytoplasma asteris]|uniref:Uncharacterized protein n=1 Tax=Candidatus Phytoplasma asteris TaxID=85620 RepID=A0ABZ2YES7_9MOLU